MDEKNTNLVLIDGEIMPMEEAFVDVNDRGHNFGDGVFELVPVYNGRCFALLPLMNNLFDSVISVKIPGVYMIEELVEFHENLIAATGLENCEIYTQITRGSAPYGLAYPEPCVPRLTMFAVPVDREALAEKRSKGVNVITEKDERWSRCDVNTLNRLPDVVAKQKALLAAPLMLSLCGMAKSPRLPKPASLSTRTVCSGPIRKTISSTKMWFVAC